MSAPRTLDQERAAAALRAVEEVRDKPHRSEYRSLSEGLPALLVASGLAPALAFLAAKADRGKPHGELGRQVAAWVLERVFDERPQGNEALARCLQRITQGDSATYRQAEHEALELAVWIKRFAQAYIEKEGPA